MDLACDKACYRVLIIDDNRALHDDYRKILAQERHDSGLGDLETELFGESRADKTEPAGVTFELDSAFQGKEGFEKVQQAVQEGRPYALAFVDMRMPPGWDGLETIEHIWRASPELQIVVCTAYSDHSWSEISNRLGSTDQLLVLKKPFDRIEIIQAAHALVKKWCLSQNARQQRDEWDVQMRERAAALEAANQKLAEEKITLERMRTVLRLSQKLETVGQLAAGLVHEIDTPIQYVENNLVFLKDSFQGISALSLQCREALGGHALQTPGLSNPGGDSLEELLRETRSALDQAQEGVRRVADIVGAMKEFVSSERPQTVLADINRSLSNTLSIAGSEYRHIADIETDFGDIPLIPCSIGDINQAFLNIIINAAHAIDKKRRAGGGDGRGLIKITTSFDSEAVEIRIQDTGCGIPDDVKDSVFDPIFAANATENETGQGLPVAHHILVEQHRGELRFDSRVDEGTLFTIRLPRNPVEALNDMVSRYDKILGLRK